MNYNAVFCTISLHKHRNLIFVISSYFELKNCNLRLTIRQGVNVKIVNPD